LPAHGVETRVVVQAVKRNLDRFPEDEILEERYDEQFKVVFDALRELMMPPKSGGKAIGYD
jgi:hypothetical protein